MVVGGSYSLFKRFLCAELPFLHCNAFLKSLRWLTKPREALQKSNSMWKMHAERGCVKAPLT